MNYITLGYDCSPASALRNLQLRQFALPFDWIVAFVDNLDICFQENFSRFHTNLRYNHTQRRVIDDYGFEYPHDYPLENEHIDNIEEAFIGEVVGKVICSNYMDYYDAIYNKYKRRIERFLNIMHDKKPIIVLCRHSTSDVLKLQESILKNYKKENVYFVNSTSEEFENNKIINIFTEKNGNWNEDDIWEKGIERIKSKIDYTL